MWGKTADFLHIRALIDTKTLLQQFMKQQMKECFFFVAMWACYSCPLIHGRSPVLEPLFLDRDERHMTGLFLTWGIVVKGVPSSATGQCSTSIMSPRCSDVHV